MQIGGEIAEALSVIDWTEEEKMPTVREIA
jgi:hypothetical protein